MQIPKSNQTLQQLDNKETSKGLKRPIEDLFSDQELLLSQREKRKRFKRTPSNQLPVPEFKQDHGVWRINIPKNSNCLFMAAVLSYLIPVAKDDNLSDFRDRFDKLFLERGQQATSEDKFNKIRKLIQEYNPFLNKEVYEDETLKELIQQFRKKVVGFIRDNKSKFQGKLGSDPENYLSSIENTNTWGTDVEVEAISGLLECKLRIFSNTDHRDVSYHVIEIPQLKLFHDTTAAGGSKDGEYYNLGLEGSIGNKYDVDRRLEGFVEDFVFIYERCLSEYSERLENRMPKNGKWAEFIHKITEMGAGASELTAGRVPELEGGVIKAGVSVGLKFIDNVASGIGASQNWKALKKLTQPIKMFRENRDEVIKLLVESGVDIFQRFESQFTRITARDGTDWKGAMEKLAKDSVSRVISYYRVNFESEEEFSTSLITKGVILGESKRYKGAFLDRPRWNKGLDLKIEGFKASTAGLFDKVGLVATDPNGKIKGYYKKEDNSKKYGFRLLFQWENQNLLKGEVATVNDKQYTFLSQAPENKYEYLLGAKSLTEKQKEILGKIKNKKEDQKKDDDIVKMMQDFGEDFLGKLEKSIGDNFNDLLVEIGKNHEQIAEWFSEVKQIISEEGKSTREHVSKEHQETREQIAEGFEKREGKDLIEFLDEGTRSRLTRINIGFKSGGELEKFVQDTKNQNTENKENKILNVIADKDASLLTLAKINGVLPGKDDGYIFMELDSVLTEDRNVRAKLRQAFGAMKIPVDVLIMDCTESNISKENIEQLKESGNLKNIILVTSKADQKLEYYEDKINFNDLTTDSQKAVLKEEVIFQGNKVPLNKLINEGDKDLEKIISAKDLSKLVNGKSVEIEIGEALPNLGITKDYYIPRKFNHQVRIKEGFLKEQNDIFVIKGKVVNLEKLEEKINDRNLVAYHKTNRESSKRFFLLDGILDKEFDELSYELNKKLKQGKEQEKNVHLLSLSSDGKFTWEKSYGSLKNLREYLDNVKQDKDEMVNEDFLKERQDDIFVIIGEQENFTKLKLNENKVTSSIDEDSFKQEELRFFLLSSIPTDNDFKKLCDHYSKKGNIQRNAHLLSLSNNGKFTRKKFHRIGDTVAIEDKVAIISAEPGMGKSTVLTDLAQKIKKENSELWVVRINLNDRTLSKVDNNLVHNDESVIKSLLTIMEVDIPEEINEPLEKKLFEHNFNRGKVALLFDAFDEIGHDSEGKAIKLLQDIRDINKVERLLVTTRTHKQNELEDKLSVLSYALEPLSKKEQKEFLERFWKANFTYDMIRELITRIYQEEISKSDGVKKISEVIESKIIESGENSNLRKIEKLVSEFNKDNRSDKEKLVKQITDLIGEQREASREAKNKVEEILKSDYALNDIKNKVIENARKYAEELIEKSPIPVSDKEREFTEIPLQIRMLAEAFQGNFEKGGELVLDVKFTLLDLYRKFIESKYDTYFRKYLKEDLRKEGKLKELRDSLTRALTKEHRSLALQMLFSKEVKDSLRDKDPRFENIQDVGIIDKITDGSPEFIHRTFAEYFAADFFVDALEKPENHPKYQVIRNFLRDNIFKKENEVIRNFFDRMSASGSEIHVAVLNEYEEKIEDLLRINEKDLSEKDKNAIKSIIDSRDKAGRTSLHLAAAYGCKEIVDILLGHNADVKANNEIFGWSPLVYAAQGGSWSIAKLFLEKGAESSDLKKVQSFRSFDEEGVTLLHFAISHTSDTDTIKFVIDKGADVNARDSNVNTPLHLAAQRGYEEIVKDLLKKGAMFDAKNREGNTPLELADGYEGIKKILTFTQRLFTTIKDDPLNESERINKLEDYIKEGAILNSSDKDGKTPLYWAAKKEKKKKCDVVKLLIEKGANVNAKDENGETLLHWVAKERKWDVVKYLIEEKGADLNLSQKGGAFFTPLYWAVYSDEFEAVEYLIEKGVNINAKSGVGETPLHRAALCGRFKIMKYLIEKGADLNSPDSDGQTPLHLAAANGHLDLVKYFVEEKGTDVNAKDNDARTPLHMAARSGKLDVVEYLFSKVADVNAKAKDNSTPLQMAAEGDNNLVVDYLIKKGADLNIHGQDGWPFLHSADESWKLDVDKLEKQEVKDFLRENIFKTKNKAIRYFFDCTLADKSEIHIAVLNNNKEKVKGLLKKDRSIIDISDKAGRTSLHLAAAYGYKEIVDVLLEHNANVNDNDKLFDWSPLTYSIKCSSLSYCEDIAKLLLKKGANGNNVFQAIEIENKEEKEKGQELLYIAAKNGYAKFIEAFLNSAKEKLSNEQLLEFVNAKDYYYAFNYGHTPLQLAVENGNKEVIQSLLNSVKGKFSYEQLLKFISFVNERAMHIYLEYKSEKNRDRLGDSDKHRDRYKPYLAIKSGEYKPLCIAIKSGKQEIIETLLNYVQEELSSEQFLQFIDAKDYGRDGNTLLHLAAEGNLDIVKLLVEKGANFAVTDSYDSTPLHRAAEMGNLDVVKYLIEEKGADLNVQDKDGKTPLGLATGSTKNILQATQELFTYVKAGDLQGVNNCIGRAAIINAKDTDGSTPISLAAENGYIDIVKALNKDVEHLPAAGLTESILQATQELFTYVKAGNLQGVNNCIGRMAIINATDSDDRLTPLHYAAQSGYKDIVEALLNKDADINAKDKNGKTPLHWAAKNDKSDVVKYLVEKGTDINVQDKDGKTPLGLATGSTKNILQATQELFTYVKAGDLQGVNNCIGRTAIINAKDNNGRTPLHLAAGFILDKSDLVEYLITKNADVNARDKDGQTPLHFAVKNGCDKVVEVLIKYIRDTDPNELNKFINTKDNEGNTSLDLLEKGKSKKDPLALRAYSEIAGLLKFYSKQQEVGPTHQEGASPQEQCPPSSESSGRRKREAVECELSWEDVDEFNEEKEEVRDFSKIKINSDRFINYIKSESMSETKLAQLVELPEKVQVTGELQSLVNKLISNQKVMNHLNRVGRVSGIAMHGMMGKATLASFLNDDYTGVAVNLGFIAGGQGFARVAQAASIKGTGLILDGKLLLGRSLKAASPFLARGTSAFVVYDLVNQIKAFKNGTEEALIGVIGDSIYLGVDAAEVGIEIAEAFDVLEGVSSITGPIGAAVGAVVFVGTDIYIAVKRVDKINEIIHLTWWEKFKEGWHAFLSIQPEQYIEELMEEKEVSNQLVKQGLEYLKQHSDIKRYVFPTGKSVIDSCRDVPYKTSECVSGGFGGGCSKTRTVTRYVEECTTKIQVDLDSKVLLDEKRTDIKWSRTRPDNPSEGELFCLPQGDYEQVPSGSAYLCENAIGVTDSANKTENHTLINLGKGNDHVEGFQDSNNIFVVDDGLKRYYGGKKDDTFIVQGNIIKGDINGRGGVNSIDLEWFASEQKRVQVSTKYITHGNNTFGIINIQKILARREKEDIISCACDTQHVDGRGGKSNATDTVIIPSADCSYELQVVARPSTIIYNYAQKGNFTYIVPQGKGEALINLKSNGSKHNFLFDYVVSDLEGIDAKNIDIKNVDNKVTFSFLSSSSVKEDNLLVEHARSINIIKDTLHNGTVVGEVVFNISDVDKLTDEHITKPVNVTSVVSALSPYYKEMNSDSFNVTISNKHAMLNAIRTMIASGAFGKEVREKFNVTIEGVVGNSSYILNDGTGIKIGNKGNLYAVQNSNRPIDEIINNYPGMANRLRMSLFIQSLLSNETIAIGHGNHDVLHNNPYYKSHLIGNGGANIFVIASGYEKLDDNKLPIPEVIIYDVDKENLIDTLDLRQIKQQIVKDLSKEVKARTGIRGKDLLIELFYPNSTQSLVTVRLKDALETNWHERLHVIVDNVPMKIEEFELKPLPLIFDESDRNIIVIGPEDIEKESKIVVSKEIGNYTFARLGNDLIITNAFSPNLKSNELCTISLNNFYQEPKMQTLSIKFADKEITLIDKINSTSTFADQLNKLKNVSSIIDNYSNHIVYKDSQSKNGNVNTNNHRQERSINLEGQEFFNAQNDANTGLKVASGASRLSSWVNIVANKVVGAVAVGLESMYSRFKNNINAKHTGVEADKFETSGVALPEINSATVNSGLMLADLAIRKYNKENYKADVGALSKDRYMESRVNLIEKNLHEAVKKYGNPQPSLKEIAIEPVNKSKVIGG